MGTRFLPATKTVPKELLPVVDTPGIELVAAEAAEAGAERLVIITSEGKDGVVAHFVEDLVLEGTLEARGKKAMLAKVRRAPGLIKVESVVQAEPLGLGHAVSCVEPVLSPDEDAVSVLLPDDLVLPTGVLETMAKVRAAPRRHGAVRHRGLPRRDQRLRRLRRRAGPGGDNPDVLQGQRHGGEAASRRSPVVVSPRPVATSSTGPSSMRCDGSSAEQAVKSSSPTRSRC